MQTDRANNRTKQLLTLFSVFFKISAITVGGGLTMVPVMEQEFQEKRKWITAEDMAETLALVQSMPGIIAVNMALSIGYRVARVPGALVSAIGVVIPPFLAILVIAYCFSTLSGSETVSGIFRSVRAAVCALILLSAVKMGKVLLKRSFPVIVTAAAFAVFVFFPQVNVIGIIILAGIAGLIVCHPKKETDRK